GASGRSNSRRSPAKYSASCSARASSTGAVPTGTSSAAAAVGPPGNSSARRPSSSASATIPPIGESRSRRSTTASSHRPPTRGTAGPRCHASGGSAQLDVEDEAVRAVVVDLDRAPAGDAGELVGAAAGHDEEELRRPPTVAGVGGGVGEGEPAASSGHGAVEALGGDVGAADGGVVHVAELRDRAPLHVAGELLDHAQVSDGEADREVGRPVDRPRLGDAERPLHPHQASRGGHRQNGWPCGSSITVLTSG